MKKLMTIALIFSAATLFAEQPPALEPYCECRGVGIPTATVKTEQRPNISATGQAKQLTPLQRFFYEMELAWIFIQLPHVQ